MTETTPTTQRDQGAPSPTHQAVTVKDPKLSHIYLHDRRDDPKAGTTHPYVWGEPRPSPARWGGNGPLPWLLVLTRLIRPD